jgi:transposase-like protein
MERNNIHEYAKAKLLNSRIDFFSVPKKDILATCKAYRKNLSKDTYNAVVKAINDIYNK